MALNEYFGYIGQTCLSYTWNQHFGTNLARFETGLDAYFLKEYEFEIAC